MIYDRIIMDAEEIGRCIERLGREISAAYRPEDFLLAVVVLEGAARFAGDLLARVVPAPEVVYIHAASYHGGTASTGTVTLKGDLSDMVSGRKVLIIDDIYDSGRTLNAILNEVIRHGQVEVKTCVLLEKDRPHEVPVAVDFVGRRIEDTFLIGYGLDYEGRYRDLPFVAAMTPRTRPGASGGMSILGCLM